MAERAGFEPAVRFDAYDGLANRCFRPLSHLSLPKPQVNRALRIQARKFQGKD